MVVFSGLKEMGKSTVPGNPEGKPGTAPLKI